LRSVSRTSGRALVPRRHALRQALILDGTEIIPILGRNWIQMTCMNPTLLNRIGHTGSKHCQMLGNPMSHFGEQGHNTLV